MGCKTYHRKRFGVGAHQHVLLTNTVAPRQSEVRGLGQGPGQAKSWERARRAQA
jgi:hypothetical protein